MHHCLWHSFASCRPMDYQCSEATTEPHAETHIPTYKSADRWKWQSHTEKQHTHVDTSMRDFERFSYTFKGPKKLKVKCKAPYRQHVYAIWRQKQAVDKNVLIYINKYVISLFLSIIYSLITTNNGNGHCEMLQRQHQKNEESHYAHHEYIPNIQCHECKLCQFLWLIVLRCGPSDTGSEQIEPVLLNHKYSGDAGVMVFAIYMQLIIKKICSISTIYAI